MLNIATAMKAYQAWDSVKNLELGTVDQAALSSVAGLFNHQLSVEHGDAIVALLSGEDPTITLGQFLQTGGLFRLINGQNGASSAPARFVTRCPHCNELHTAG